jgi:hypothetical protein
MNNEQREKITQRDDYPFRVYLGRLKDESPYNQKVYLTGFSWDCQWYWGGGYIRTKDIHTHTLIRAF